MKKVIIAPDSFKGTMSSVEICEIIEAAVKRVRPDIETVKIPMADGGEGTADAFLTAVGGRKIGVKVLDPLFREIDSYYAILNDGKTAVIEMAAASGLMLAGDDKNPSNTTTYGTGQFIKDALDRGCRDIIIGIGGSATNDGGIGAAAALGVKFFDRSLTEIPLTGAGLAKLAIIDASSTDVRLRNCRITVACDVSNPLYGPEGAAHVFAPQKGADVAMVERLDNNLKHYAKIIKDSFGTDPQLIAGTGAAGGLGVALIVFAGARLARGIDIMLDVAGFDNALCDADLVITGEGRIDSQSLRGKVPVGIAGRAARSGVPVIAIVGDVGDDLGDYTAAGICAVFCTSRKPLPFETAKTRCKEDLRATAESVVRLASAMSDRQNF